MAISDVKEIRERLTALNNKAYYLIVALSFMYGKSQTIPIKVGFVLTALVAALPMQDYVESAKALERLRWFKVAALSLAFFSTVWWVLT